MVEFIRITLGLFCFIALGGQCDTIKQELIIKGIALVILLVLYLTRNK